MDSIAANRTSWKVALPMIGMGVFLLALANFAALNVHQQQQLSSQLVSREVNGMVTIQELNQTVREIRYQINLFLRVDDPSHLEAALKFNGTAQLQIERAQGFARTPREHELIEAAAAGYADFFGRFARVTEPLLKREPQQGRKIEIDDAERESLTHLSDVIITNDVLGHLQKCFEANQEVVARTDAASQETAQHLKIGFILLGICGGAGGLLTGLAIARTLGRSMVQLHISVRSVAERLSNLTGPVTFSRTSDLAGIEWDLRTVEQDIVAVIERLNQRESELLRSEQLARVGQLVAGLAHELRNPLMPMKMLVQAAIERGDEGELKGRPLRVLNEEIARLEHSIQMFLDFARPPVPEKRSADIREVVNGTLELIRGRARQQHVEIEVLPTESPVLLNVDRNQLRQLLLNLFLNALDVMPSGGKLEIALDSAAQPPASSVDGQTITAFMLLPPEFVTEHDAMRLPGDSSSGRRRPARWLAVRVADTGPGIPPGMKDTLFEPFVTTKESGIGLGLSICQHVAAAHGGTLCAKNRPRGGAEFTLLLPFPDESPA